MRRATSPRKLARTLLAGCAAALAVGLVVPDVEAETAQPGISFEGWFALNRPQNPVVPVPCTPGPTPCGPVNPAPVPAPQSPGTGAYVVSSAGGDSGRSATSGDTGWAAFQWDLLSHLGATADRYVVTLSQAPDNRGDYGTPVFQACNIVAPWASEPGPNPWPDRPTPDCSEAVVPELKDGRYRIDLTDFAQSWLDGKGYGVVILPGIPDTSTGIAPFQYTFAGYYNTSESAAEVVPKVDFRFTPALDEGGFGGDGGGFGGELIGDEVAFEPVPDIDVIPDDVGSPPLDDSSGAASGDGGSPVASPAGRRASQAGFPVSILFLLPLGLAGFWGIGTALGPAGDPAPVRKGGVSRMIERHRANDSTDQRKS